MVFDNDNMESDMEEGFNKFLKYINLLCQGEYTLFCLEGLVCSHKCDKRTVIIAVGVLGCRFMPLEGRLRRCVLSFLFTFVMSSNVFECLL